jgi:hypothetical protein
MRSVLVAVLVACGSPTVASRSPSRPAPSPPPRPAVTAEAFCEHVDKLASKCPRFANLRMERATCLADVGANLGSGQDPRFAAIATCVVEHDDCDAVLDCVAADQADATAPEALRACDDPGSTAEHAVGIARSEWDQRNGAGVTAFRDVRSTKAAPIEMCGVSEANDWLVSLRCNDGSQPLNNRRDAEDFRAGNVGSGGRCRSIIDRYLVLCPERRYEIFIDAYICPRPD